MCANVDRIALITGASRGVGKGVALALAKKGTVIYITARTRKEGDSPLPGSLETTARAIVERGGKAVEVYCDHADGEAIKNIFKIIEKESGRLDILVNNVFKAPAGLTRKGGFWEKPLALFDDLVIFALRAHYIASYYAVPLMIKNGGGLIVNISSYGAGCYMHGPAYGVGKAGVDKLAADMARDLEDHNIAAISLWLSMVRTEQVERMLKTSAKEKWGDFTDHMESPQFAGRVIDALASDLERMKKSGRAYIAAELAQEYKITDIDGSQPRSWRDVLGAPAVPASAKIG